jgi:hypothetical protein
LSPGLRRCIVLDLADVQHGAVKVDLVPPQVADLGGATCPLHREMRALTVLARTITVAWAETAAAPRKTQKHKPGFAAFFEGRGPP